MKDPSKKKQIVITGGGTGIGAAIADRVAKTGAQVTLMGRTENRLHAKAQTLPDADYAVR